MISAQIENAFMVMWMFFTGTSTVLKLFGFGVIEAGLVRRKNAKSVMIKTLFGLASSGLAFWLFGYAFAFGCSGSDCDGFIGSNYFALSGLEGSTSPFKRSSVGYAAFFERFAVTNICFGIVSGALTERTKPQCYVIVSFFLSAFIFPVVVHWVWGGGWLEDRGVLDFAGGGVVHLLSGCAAMVGAFVIGPRKGRFIGNIFSVQTNPFEVQSPAFNTLGMMVLWTGWYGFNAVHTNIVTQIETVQLVAVNTSLAPSMSVLTSIVLDLLASNGKNISAERVMSAARIGLTSITASCAFVEPYISIVIGFIAAFIYFGTSRLLKQLKIDDPVDAVPCHLFGGLWGMIAVGLFAKDNHIQLASPGYLLSHEGYYGVVYGGNGLLLGWQIVAVLTILAWTTVLSGFMFLICKKLNLGRVDEETEVYGLHAEGEHDVVKGVNTHTKFEEQREIMLRQQQEFKRVAEKQKRAEEEQKKIIQQLTYNNPANGGQVVFTPTQSPKAEQ